jgi:MoxR-like ATPase
VSAPQAVGELAGALRTNIARAMVGRAETVDLLLVALLARGHVLLEDLPGTGKTTLCRALAASLHCRFGRIQFTPDLMPADVLGVNVYDAHRQRFEFKPGPVFANIVLADEINRATPRAQSALLEAMQEAQVSVDGVTTALPSPFMVVATQNPLEMEGTFALPEAQLDRFMLRLSVGLPDRDEEAALLDRYRGRHGMPELAPVADAAALDLAREAVDAVAVAAPVRDYILDIIAATRSDERLRLGASPRAALALQSASQARAALSGRGFVIPDDVKAVAQAVLAHRVIVDTAAALRGIEAARVVRDLLARIAVPIVPVPAAGGG